MIKLDSLTLNGKSTADFPFFVAVEEMPGVVRANKKDILNTQIHTNGYIKQSINAYEAIELQFAFYVHGVTRQQLREFKTFFKDEGTIVRYDDPDIHYNYQSVEVESEPLDEANGYVVTANFKCEPFEYETEKEIVVGGSIDNHTNAPMYPRIIVKGNHRTQTQLTIGNQTMYFKDGIDTQMTIECKHGIQNVFNKSNQLINNQVKGPFFEIPIGISNVSKGPGITEVKMLTRWGWR